MKPEIKYYKGDDGKFHITSSTVKFNTVEEAKKAYETLMLRYMVVCLRYLKTTTYSKVVSVLLIISVLYNIFGG